MKKSITGLILSFLLVITLLLLSCGPAAEGEQEEEEEEVTIQTRESWLDLLQLVPFMPNAIEFGGVLVTSTLMLYTIRFQCVEVDAGPVNSYRDIIVPATAFDAFDPLMDAVVFSDDPVKVQMQKDTDITLKGERYELTCDDGVQEVPCHVAVFLFGRKAATLAE